MVKKGLIKDIATSSTTLIFLVVGITGVMMYFHLYNGEVKLMHEILGLVFIGAALIHVFANFKQMKQYFSKKIFFSISALVFVAVIGFVIESQSKGGGVDPKKLAIQKVLSSPIEKTFVLFSEDMDESKMKLEDAGIKIEGSTTIMQIAKANGTSPFRIVSILSK